MTLGGSHRHHARRPHRAGRHAGRGVSSPGDALRREFHRLPADEPSRGRDRRRSGRIRQRRSASAAAGVSQRFAAKGRKIVFGLRPDDVYPSGHGLASGHAGAVHERPLTVSLTEPLGNETLVFLQFRRARMVVAHAQSAHRSRQARRSRSASISPTRICSTPPPARRSSAWETDMAKIERVELRMVDLPPKVKRVDAIQSFVSQETPIVSITDTDGAIGVGYSYTIGTGGSSVMRLLADHLAPRMLGQRRRPHRSDLARARIRHPRHDHRRHHGAGAGRHRYRAVGLELQTAQACRCGSPRAAPATGARSTPPKAAGCICPRKLWSTTRLRRARKGFRGSKIKIGRPHVAEDRARLARRAQGARRRFRDHDRRQPGPSRSTRRSAAPGSSPSSISPGSRSRCRPTTSTATCGLTQSTSTPIAIGESLYSIRHFREYLARGRLLDRADRRRADRRYHAVAEGRACGGSVRRAGVPAFPDGVACQPRLRRAERPLCRIHPAARRSDDAKA